MATVCGLAVVFCALSSMSACAKNSMGLTVLSPHGSNPGDAQVGAQTLGPVTVFYPSSTPARTVQRGPFSFNAAVDGDTLPGHGRLVVISHGSGGSPWTFTHLAQALVDAGFVVALPRHRGDNAQDPSRTGPESWKQRPAEVSQTIDRMASDPRVAQGLRPDRVGVYGMSAGGHTVLTLAGGRWSPGCLKRHCEQHITEDFHSCVGLTTQLRGNWLDGIKKWVALRIIGWRFDDDTAYGHDDPRIAAAIAGVPFAADFDLASFAPPRIPMALITAAQDRWLLPRFHSDRLLQACAACEVLAALPDAGHGALLSPPPPALQGLLAELLNDPPGFDRQSLKAVDQRIVAYFERHLLAAP